MNYLALIQSKNLLYIYIKVKNPLSALDKERQVITLTFILLKNHINFTHFLREQMWKKEEKVDSQFPIFLDFYNYKSTNY